MQIASNQIKSSHVRQYYIRTERKLICGEPHYAPKTRPIPLTSPCRSRERTRETLALPRPLPAPVPCRRQARVDVVRGPLARTPSADGGAGLPWGSAAWRRPRAWLLCDSYGSRPGRVVASRLVPGQIRRGSLPAVQGPVAVGTCGLYSDSGRTARLCLSVNRQVAACTCWGCMVVVLVGEAGVVASTVATGDFGGGPRLLVALLF